MSEETTYPEWDRILAAWDQGLRARDWPTENLPQLIEETRDKWPATYILYIAYLVAVDLGNFQEAHRYVLDAFEESGKWQWEDIIYLAVAFEKLFIEAVLRFPNKQLHYLFDELPDNSEDLKYSVLRAQIALKTANREFEEANRLADHSRALLREQFPEMMPRIQAELDWIDLALGESRAWQKDHCPVASPSLFDKDSLGWTTLFHAAVEGDLEPVKAIIFRLPGTGLFPSRLALLNSKDNSGMTAADVAEQKGHLEIAQLLRAEMSRMEYSK